MQRWLLIFALIVACHHDPDPVEPAGTPPLPPASGTPIGFLIDDADLHLSTDQLGKLRDIDTALAAQIDTIDKATRSANKPASPDPSQQPQQSMGRRGRRGGMGGNGGGQRHSGSGGGSAAAAATTSKLADERTEDVKAALGRAFALFDPKQQARAKQVLADHDVDLDLDAPAPPAPPPSPAADEEPAPPPPPTIPPPTLPPPSQSQAP